MMKNVWHICASGCKIISNPQTNTSLSSKLKKFWLICLNIVLERNWIFPFICVRNRQNTVIWMLRIWQGHWGENRGWGKTDKGKHSIIVKFINIMYNDFSMLVEISTSHPLFLGEIIFKVRAIGPKSSKSTMLYLTMLSESTVPYFGIMSHTTLKPARVQVDLQVT